MSSYFTLTTGNPVDCPLFYRGNPVDSPLTTGNPVDSQLECFLPELPSFKSRKLRIFHCSWIIPTGLLLTLPAVSKKAGVWIHDWHYFYLGYQERDNSTHSLERLFFPSFFEKNNETRNLGCRRALSDRGRGQSSLKSTGRACFQHTKALDISEKHTIPNNSYFSISIPKSSVLDHPLYYPFASLSVGGPESLYSP